MTREDFEKLLVHPEDTWIDWKRDFPKGLLQTRRGDDPKEWDNGKGDLIKDLVSIANRSDEKPHGFLVYGVQDHGTKREVIGILKSWDDGATFQTWLREIVEPQVLFSYSELHYYQSKKVGIFKINISPEYPHIIKQTVGDVIFKGQVWFRLGSMNEVALYSDLKNMFRSPDPFIITFGERNARVYKDIKKYYEDKGYQLFQLPLARKDISLLEGYEIAYYPGTRRGIHIEEPLSIDRYDIMMMKGKS